MSTSSDPLAPFSGEGVHFLGWASGGSAEMRADAYLVYRFRIEFAEEVQLDCITVGGAGDQNNNAVLRLLDENMNEIAVQPTTGFNTYGIHTLHTGGAIGKIFFLDEFDYSTTFRFRDLILFQCEGTSPEFNPETGNWYQAIPFAGGIDWESARAAAETYELEVEPEMFVQGHLATITCPTEIVFIQQQFPYAVSGGYWLGGYQPSDDAGIEDEFPAAGWEWVTGEPFTYSNWAYGEPNDWGFKENAMQFWHGEGTWNDEAKESLIPGFVVEYSVNLGPECPQKATNPDNGHIYEAVSVPEGVDWDEANLIAQEMGGHLATLNSPEENQFVFDVFPGASLLNESGYWIGGIQPGDIAGEPDADPAAGWEWVTGEPFTYSNWAYGEPNDWGFKENAMQLWHGEGAWNDEAKESLIQGFVVEYEDSDGDGVPDGFDECPNSDVAATIVIDGCDSGLVNSLLEGGCTLSDIIANAAAVAKNHGAFLSAVSELGNELRSSGIISNKENGRLQSCAARANIP